MEETRDLHPLVERAIRRTGDFRVHHPRICCKHAWRAIDALGPLHQRCASCDATCVRDPRTKQIIEYELPVKLEWYEQSGGGQPIQAERGRAA